jgi:hypothetical protein
MATNARRFTPAGFSFAVLIALALALNLKSIQNQSRTANVQLPLWGPEQKLRCSPVKGASNDY